MFGLLSFWVGLPELGFLGFPLPLDHHHLEKCGFCHFELGYKIGALPPSGHHIPEMFRLLSFWSGFQNLDAQMHSLPN